MSEVGDALSRLAARRAARSRVAIWLAAVAAIALSGCVSGSLTAYRADAPATIELPLGADGATDARIGFLPWFTMELRRDPRFSGSPPSRWLHGVRDADPPSSATTDRPLRGLSVLLVPGLFGDCLGARSMPFADGADHAPERRATEAYAAYADLGARAMRLVDLPGRASTDANGARLATAIRAEAADPAVEAIVLVAYSKGVADALQALDRLHAEGTTAKVVALVSVAGTVMGTPVADRFAGVYDRIADALDPLDCTPSEGGEIDSITREQRLAWLVAHPPPQGVAYYSVVAHAAAAELAPGLRATGRLLSRVDPRNDGQMIASHAVLPRSELLAIAHTDHWGIALAAHADPRWLVRTAGPRSEFPREALLRAVLRYVAAQMPVKPG